MKLLILSGCLVLLTQSSAIAATGGKGAGSYASAQGSSNAALGGSSSRSGGGGGTVRKPETRNAPPLAGDRTINEQDCTKPIDWIAGNLKCK